MDVYFCDFIVSLPFSFGFDAIMVVIDHFTKIAYFILCKNNNNLVQLAHIFLTPLFL